MLFFKLSRIIVPIDTVAGATFLVNLPSSAPTFQLSLLVTGIQLIDSSSLFSQREISKVQTNLNLQLKQTKKNRF